MRVIVTMKVIVRELLGVPGYFYPNFETKTFEFSILDFLSVFTSESCRKRDSEISETLLIRIHRHKVTNLPQ